MSRFLLPLVFGAFFLAGCSEAARERAALQSVAARRAEEPAATPGETAFASLMTSADSAPGDGDATTPPPPNAAGISRKVIYDTTIDLIVKSIDEAAAAVARLTEQSGGYIAEETVSGSPGSTRSRFWKLRIPIERFESLIASVSGLGELERLDRKSQDVTAEFYDVEARVKNKKVEEQTLQKLLEERSGELADVLKVEAELSRVRGEIERLQGQLRVLDNLTALATLTLTVRERVTYEPAAPIVADFPTQISRVWNDSVRSLVDLGKSWTLFAVGQVVWLPFWIVGLLLARLAFRRFSAGLRKLFAAATTPIRVSIGNPPAPDAGEGTPTP